LAGENQVALVDSYKAFEFLSDKESDVVETVASVSDDYLEEADGTWLNEYKMLMRQGDIYVEVVDYPLANTKTKADIEAFSFSHPDAPGRFRDAVKKYKNDYLIFGDIEVNVFSLPHQLAGMEVSDNADGVHFIKLEEDYSIFKVASGKNNFTSNLKK
jgi:hypothetical protein